MITRKSKIVSTTKIWPYTPEPSPPLGPTSIHIPIDDLFSMSDEPGLLRPISITSKRDGTLSPAGRPTLDDVLNSRAPSPYTLAAYTAFLSQQHCLETLEFVTEAKKYSTKYYDALASLAGMPFNTDSNECLELTEDWQRLLDIYVKPGAPREINLPAEERDDLIDYPYVPKPPPPEALEPSVRRMYDLMSDSIFIPFCNSVRGPLPLGSQSAGSGLSERLEAMDKARLSSERQHNSRRKRSPPTTSPNTQRNTQQSALTSALTRTSSARLSTHFSHSSAVSEAAMSDESGSGYSPGGADLDAFASPPLTPPQSDIPTMVTHSTTAGLRPTRSDSGGWKRLGRSIFGGKKKPTR